MYIYINIYIYIKRHSIGHLKSHQRQIFTFFLRSSHPSEIHNPPLQIVTFLFTSLLYKYSHPSEIHVPLLQIKSPIKETIFCKIDL